MKNIHILSTDKPSRLYLTTHEYIFEEGYSLSTDECENKHIYITSDEKIKEGDWCYQPELPNLLEICKHREGNWMLERGFKKIILTTDQDLIKDGVQAIDDEFLEWFVKNPSCEYVDLIGLRKEKGYEFLGYEIIIPKETPKTFKELFANTGIEPTTDETGNIQYNFKATMKEELKQETTLEEIAEKYVKDSSHELYELRKQCFLDGAKWQQEQIGKSEFLQKLRATLSDAEARRLIFEQFKNK